MYVLDFAFHLFCYLWCLKSDQIDGGPGHVDQFWLILPDGSDLEKSVNNGRKMFEFVWVTIIKVMTCP